MMNIIIDRMPGILTFVCTVLAYVIPVATYKINKKIHTNLDPPWKQQSQNDNNQQ